MEQKKIGCGLRKQRKGGVNKLNEKWEEELLEENPPYELEKLDKAKKQYLSENSIIYFD